jgi:hypothetical protein
MTNNEHYAAQLNWHFMRIVNMCRDGITDDEIRITAGYCGIPEWLVMRIARDMGVLTDIQEERYQSIIKMLAERDK